MLESVGQLQHHRNILEFISMILVIDFGFLTFYGFIERTYFSKPRTLERHFTFKLTDITSNIHQFLEYTKMEREDRDRVIFNLNGKIEKLYIELTKLQEELKIEKQGKSWTIDSAYKEGYMKGEADARVWYDDKLNRDKELLRKTLEQEILMLFYGLESTDKLSQYDKESINTVHKRLTKIYHPDGSKLPTANKVMTLINAFKDDLSNMVYKR